MLDLKQYEVWFVTGSQHLYGPKTLEQVAAHSQEIARALSASARIPIKVVFKPVLTTRNRSVVHVPVVGEARDAQGLRRHRYSGSA